MSVVVFVGPTLPVDLACADMPARYLPPVACGDIEQVLLHDRPRAIGIIDGYFDKKPAVFHKEILRALALGVRVYGAASMGALRAAELHTFGMIGVGRIFEAFRDGEMEDDDEVAVVHGPADVGYRGYSDAMVNLRDGLQRAFAAGVISESAKGALIADVKAAYYPERSWARVFDAARRLQLPHADLREFVARERPNLKRDDAKRMLARMAADAAAETASDPVAFRFADTTWSRALRRNVDHASSYGVRVTADVPPHLYSLHAALFCEAPALLAQHALVMQLVDGEAERLGIVATDAEIDRELARAGLDASRHAHRSSARIEVLTRKLVADRRPAYEHRIPIALERRGELDRTMGAVERKWRWLQAEGLHSPSLQQADVDETTLVAWYRDKTGAPEQSIAALARKVGLTPEEFVAEALRQYLFETRAEMER